VAVKTRKATSEETNARDDLSLVSNEGKRADGEVERSARLGTFVVLERSAAPPLLARELEPALMLAQGVGEHPDDFAARVFLYMRSLASSDTFPRQLVIGCNGRTDTGAIVARRLIASSYVNHAPDPENCHLVLSVNPRENGLARRTQVSLVMELSQRYRHRGVDVSLRFDSDTLQAPKLAVVQSLDERVA
jgi:hypothetical protein